MEWGMERSHYEESYILDNIISFDEEGGLPSYISTSRIRILEKSSQMDLEISWDESKRIA